MLLMLNFVCIFRKPDEAAKDSEGTAEAKPDASKVITKKMYYLSCLACRWTSRDVGIPDQAVGKI